MNFLANYRRTNPDQVPEVLGEDGRYSPAGLAVPEKVRQAESSCLEARIPKRLEAEGVVKEYLRDLEAVEK